MRRGRVDPEKVDAMMTLLFAVAVVARAVERGRPVRPNPDAPGTAFRLAGGSHVSRGVFAPIYTGLSCDAARIHAALARRHALG
jgi:hypothetical protein